MSDSFTDIAPGNSITIPISGKQIEVHGLSLKAIAAILLNYPELVELLFAKSEERQEINAMDIIKQAPNAVTDIILHGIKMQGNKKAREVADNLPGGEQIIMLSTIIKRSIGEGGFGPLVEHVEELAAMTGPLQDAVDPATAEQTTAPHRMSSPSQLNG